MPPHKRKLVGQDFDFDSLPEGWYYGEAVPFPTQRKFVEENADFGIVGFAGGPGNGKTIAHLWKVFKYLGTYPGIKGAIGRTTYLDAVRHLVPMMQTYVHELQDLYGSGIAQIVKADGSHVVLMGNGSELIVLGYDDAEKIQGSSRELWAIEEATNLSADSIQMIQRQNRWSSTSESYRARCRERNPHGKDPLLITWTANPKNGYWRDTFADPYFQGRVFEKDAHRIRTGDKTIAWFYPAITAENPFISEAYKQNLRKVHGFRKAKALMEGRWDVSENQVYDGFPNSDTDLPMEHRHKITWDEWGGIRDGEVVYAGHDPGVNHPAATLLFVVRDGAVILFSEKKVPYKKEPIAVQASWIRQQSERKCSVIGMDYSAGNKTYKGQPVPSHQSEWQRQGFSVVLSARDVRAGVQQVNQLVQTNRLKYVEGTVEELLKEVWSYRYPDEKDTSVPPNKRDLPIDEKDTHLVDALRYGIEAVWPQLATEVDKAVVAEAVRKGEAEKDEEEETVDSEPDQVVGNPWLPHLFDWKS